MSLEGILLLEGDTPVAVRLLHAFYLAVGGTYHQLSAYAAHAFYQHFKDNHYLTHGQLVERQVRQPVLVYPQLPALTGHTVPEPGTAQQLAHHQCQQLRITLAVKAAALGSGLEVPKVQSLVKDDFLLGAVLAVLAQELLVRPPGTVQVGICRLCRIPAADNVGDIDTADKRSSIVLRVCDGTVHPGHRTRREGIAYLEVHLPRLIDLPNDFRNTARPVALPGEILAALQPYAPPYEEFRAGLLNPDMIRRRLVPAHIQGVLNVVLVNRGTEFFLRQSVVLVRHADVPQDILVPRFRNQRAAGQLRIVVVRPYCDDFKLLRLAVIVHLEVMVIVGAHPGKLAALLKGYMFHQSPNLIVVGVEVQVVVSEVVNRKGLAVLVLDLFRAHAGHDADTPGIDVRKGFLLVVVDNAIPLHVDINVLNTIGQHQPAVSVFRRINVARAAYGEQACIELRIVGLVAVKGRQSLVIPERDFLTVLAAAQVYSLSLYPPFHAYGFRQLLQPVIAVLAGIVDGHVVCALHGAGLEVGRAVHAVIDVLHDQTHMVYGTGSQREHGLVSAIGIIQDEETLDKALNPVQAEAVFPFYGILFRRYVLLHRPVTLASIVDVVVNVDGNELIEREREIQQIVPLYLLFLCAAAIRLYARLYIAVAVI